MGHCTPRERAHITTAIFTTGILAAGGISLAITTPLVYPVTQSIRGTFLLWSIPPVAAAALWWLLVGDPPCRSAAVGTLGMDMAALRKVLRCRELWVAAVLFMVHNFFFYTWAGWITQYLSTLGATIDSASVITSVTLWVAIPWVIIITRLSYRVGRRKPFLWLPSLALAGISWWAAYITIPASWWLMVLTGLAASTRFTTILSLPVELVPPEQAGTASGLLMAVGYTGAIIGPYIGGRILDNTGSYQLIFFSLVIVSVINAALVIALPETGKRVKV